MGGGAPVPSDGPSAKAKGHRKAKRKKEAEAKGHSKAEQKKKAEVSWLSWRAKPMALFSGVLVVLALCSGSNGPKSIRGRVNPLSSGAAQESWPLEQNVKVGGIVGSLVAAPPVCRSLSKGFSRLKPRTLGVRARPSLVAGLSIASLRTASAQDVLDTSLDSARRLTTDVLDTSLDSARRLTTGNTCNPRTAADWYNDGCIFSNPGATSVSDLGTHNRVVATTSCEVSCPVNGGDFAVYSQSGLAAITNGNRQTAANAWVTNPTAATATYGHITWWDTGDVTVMSYLFMYQSSFNDDITHWDVSEVTNFYDAFSYVYAFNQPIGSWDVSKVTNFYRMFRGASAFNQPIGSWDVSKVTSFHGMFWDASAFNQPIGSWDVSKGTDFGSMFRNAPAFSQTLCWTIPAGASTNNMFGGASGSVNPNCPAPTPAPTQAPTSLPTLAPTAFPTEHPTLAPTDVPTGAPTSTPTVPPTATATPTEVPTGAPTSTPTVPPTATPTELPTSAPTEVPTGAPTSTLTPTVAPTQTAKTRVDYDKCCVFCKKWNCVGFQYNPTPSNLLGRTLDVCCNLCSGFSCPSAGAGEL